MIRHIVYNAALVPVRQSENNAAPSSLLTETIHSHSRICSNKHYNIPRAWLLNRSPVPAMVLKSSISGLWRHIIGTCRRLR